MTTSIHLVPLKCPRCGELVPAGEDEVAWVCRRCGQGLRLVDDGLAPIDVQWAAASDDQAAERRPFWVFRGTVTITQRQSYRGDAGPDPMWQAARQFYIPAYSATLQEIESLGAELTRRQVRLQAGRPGGDFAACVLAADDARLAAEFVVLTIEADRKDKLRQVDFVLEPIGEPELWLLPFRGDRPSV